MSPVFYPSVFDCHLQKPSCISFSCLSLSSSFLFSFCVFLFWWFFCCMISLSFSLILFFHFFCFSFPYLSVQPSFSPSMTTNSNDRRRDGLQRCPNVLRVRHRALLLSGRVSGRRAGALDQGLVDPAADHRAAHLHFRLILAVNRTWGALPAQARCVRVRVSCVSLSEWVSEWGSKWVRGGGGEIAKGRGWEGEEIQSIEMALFTFLETLPLS